MLPNNPLGEKVFEEVLFALEWNNHIREFMKVGFQNYTYVITKKEASKEDIENILDVMQAISLREYGDKKFAFKSKLWHGKNASAVLMFVTPNYYDDVKRAEGKSQSFKCLLDKMTKQSKSNPK